MQPINPSANNGFHDKRLLAQRNLWVAAIAAIIIWFVPGLNILIWPVKIFVVIIHEGCHAMLTVLTGGGVEGISINPAGSGQTISLGGDPLFIIPAGYLGATLFGAFTLLLSKRVQLAKSHMMLLGIIVMLIVGFWIHPLNNPFGFFAGLSIGVALELLARFLPPVPASYLLSFLSIELCLNALEGVWTLVTITENTNIPNDAVFMSQNYGLQPAFWAISWALISIAILWLAVRKYRS